MSTTRTLVLGKLASIGFEQPGLDAGIVKAVHTGWIRRPSYSLLDQKRVQANTAKASDDSPSSTVTNDGVGGIHRITVVVAVVVAIRHRGRFWYDPLL